MEGKKNEDKDIQDRLTVKAQRPIGFLILRKKEKSGKNLDSHKHNENRTADSMKKPDEHDPPSWQYRPSFRKPI